MRHKISEFAKTRTGERNPMYGKTHTPKVRLYLSEINKGRKLSQEHIEKLIKANTGRIKTPEEIEKLRIGNIGKKVSKESYFKMMIQDCGYKYEIYFNEQMVYWCLGHTKLNKFCETTFNISRTIIHQIVNNTWVPKFKRHQHLKSLKIKKIDLSVSTNRDECNDVEWRLTPFEVRSTQ